ncbi:MAG: LytTR family DNA-binding domain-containing protein [Synoicihabitans sp.]
MVVDDEPLAQRVIENYAGNLAFLDVEWKCDSALEALEALHQGADPDVIFLDIEMPRLSGLSMVRSLKNPPLIVFTTAYDNHAVEGFELDAVDYLKKPFSFERFTRTLDRLQQRLEAQTAETVKEESLEATLEDASPEPKKPLTGESSPPFFVRSDRGLLRVRYEEIVMIESIGDYVKFHLTDRILVNKRSLRDWEVALEEQGFVRVHRSYLIRWHDIESVEGSEIRLQDRKVPIGRAYRAKLMERLGVSSLD